MKKLFQLLTYTMLLMPGFAQVSPASTSCYDCLICTFPPALGYVALVPVIPSLKEEHAVAACRLHVASIHPCHTQPDSC